MNVVKFLTVILNVINVSLDECDVTENGEQKQAPVNTVESCRMKNDKINIINLEFYLSVQGSLL